MRQDCKRFYHRIFLYLSLQGIMLMQRKKQSTKKKANQGTTANLSRVFSTLGAGSEASDMMGQIFSNPKVGLGNMFSQMVSDPVGFEGKMNQLIEFVETLERTTEQLERSFQEATLHSDDKILKSELGPDFSRIEDAYNQINEAIEQNDTGTKTFQSIMNGLSDPSEDALTDALIEDMEMIESQLESLNDEDSDTKEMLTEQLRLLSGIANLARKEPMKRDEDNVEILKSKMIVYQESYPHNVSTYILRAAFYQMSGDHQKAERLYEDGLKQFPENERIKSYLRTIVVEVKEKEEPQKKIKETKNQRKKRLAREKKEEKLATQGDAAPLYPLGAELQTEARTSKIGVFSVSAKQDVSSVNETHTQGFSPTLTRHHIN